jgi:hypothetical protein
MWEGDQKYFWEEIFNDLCYFLKFHEVKIEICDRFDVDITQFLGRGRARL